MGGEDARHLFPVRAHLILRSGDRILLTRRAAHLPGGGRWQVPGGHLEPGESVLECAVREAREEVGVVVDPADARFVHACHVFTRTGESRIALFFEACRWHGTPTNGEPTMCDGLDFFPPTALPRPIVPYLARAIARYLRREPFGVSGHPG